MMQTAQVGGQGSRLVGVVPSAMSGITENGQCLALAMAMTMMGTDMSKEGLQLIETWGAPSQRTGLDG